MKYDQTFPAFAHRMIRITAVAAVVLAILGVFLGGLWAGAGVVFGSAFQIGFLGFLLLKERQWEQKGKDPKDIGRKMAGFAMSRLILEILLCVVIAWLTPLSTVIGYLVGLLSLTAMTLLDKVVNVIKE